MIKARLTTLCLKPGPDCAIVRDTGPTHKKAASPKTYRKWLSAVNCDGSTGVRDSSVRFGWM